MTDSGGADNASADDKTAREWKELTGTLRLVGTLGFAMVLAIAGGFLAGLWASRRFQLGPWVILASTSAGVVLSAVWAYNMLIRAALGPRESDSGASEK